MLEKVSLFLLIIFIVPAILLRYKKIKNAKESRYEEDLENIREQYRRMDLTDAVRRSNERFKNQSGGDDSGR